jgi:hypothetical protein
MKKEILESKKYYIQFSPEELKELNIDENAKFSTTVENGCILLKPYEEIEIDLNLFTKEDLINIIQLSINENLTIEETIEKLIVSALDFLEEIDKSKNSNKVFNDVFYT